MLSMSSFVRVSVFIGLLLAITIILSACQPQSPMQTTAKNCESDLNCTEELLLHVPSPEWQDQIIYFLMIDRFADGDSSNNDQGAGVFDPSKDSHYSGGDLTGIIDHLDYIKNLGATTVWTTPQVANQWWDPLANYTGYHGYWARDFKSVDEHYGTLTDYQRLSSELHKKGMYLVQDVVVNHTGNFFTYQGHFDQDDPTKNVVFNHHSLPSNKPTQFPFNQNNVTNPEHRAANIFNWTPSIQDFSLPLEETTYQTADLDDLNTLNPIVRKALKDSFGFWITEAGVDAVRIDTAKYVEKEFYEDFLHAEDGLDAMAKQTGRENFLSFGEIFQTSDPLSDNGERKLSQYVSDDSVKRLSSAIGFPLYKEISRVFAGGAPTSYLSYRLMAQMRSFKNPYLVSNFIDNHDVERFLASGNIDGFKQAYTLMMTVPGIPTIYQGDEQAFVSSRRAMFAGGHLSTHDQFNQQSEMYLFIQKLTSLRKNNKVFSRGSIEIIKDNSAGAGVLAYKRQYAGQVAYVVFNTAEQPVLLNSLQTEFTENNPAQLLASQYLPTDLNFAADGSLTVVLPARYFGIFLGRTHNTKINLKLMPNAIILQDLQTQYAQQTQAVISGTVSQPNAKLLRVIDGKVGDAKAFVADKFGNWQVDLPVNDLGEHRHSIDVFWPDKNKASATHIYHTLSTNIQHSAQIIDPWGDDTGPNGRYIKPLNKSIGCQMDITQVQARAGGSVLELDIQMCDISSLWAPPNGFDHVSFTIFFDLKSRQGKSVLPLIGGHFPKKQKWDLAHMAFGWSSYIYWSDDASRDSEGKKPGISPVIEVDKNNNRIRFIYQGNDFAVDNWKDVSIYITTWDKSGEGNYRELSENAAPWTFGGADSNEPKILDDVLIKLQPHRPEEY
jgi:glycosidase